MGKVLLEVGELVEPHSKVFQSFYDYYYHSPGILLKVQKMYTGAGHYRKSYKIRWNDGRVTNEHVDFIRKVEI
jgi:hypothetical protein